MSIVELILGRVPASWPDFFAACDGRVYGQETKHNSERAESILKLMDSGLQPSDMTATLKNAHRDPVSIPICCLATRLGDPIVVEAVLSKLPKEEKLRGLLQDVADDHCCGVESFASSLETTGNFWPCALQCFDSRSLFFIIIIVCQISQSHTLR